MGIEDGAMKVDCRGGLCGLKRAARTHHLGMLVVSHNLPALCACYSGMKRREVAMKAVQSLQLRTGLPLNGRHRYQKSHRHLWMIVPSASIPASPVLLQLTLQAGSALCQSVSLKVCSDQGCRLR